jgi:hypothetical protein
VGSAYFTGQPVHVFVARKKDKSMQQNPKQTDANPSSNQQKDPSDWVTGDEAMTGAQASYLKTLSEEANEPFDASLNKGDASKRIDALRKATGKDEVAHK